MPKNELNTLLEIKQNPSLSQRSLSLKLNISLGLTNAILQNLIHRGWVKAKKMTGRKILYLITPQGMARATNLIYDRFRETQNYYQYTKELFTSYLTDLYQRGKRMAVIYGTNQLAEITYLSILDTPLKLHSILSDDPSKKKFLGHDVLTLSDFAQKIPQEPVSENLILFCTTDKEKLSKEISKHKNIKNNLQIIYIEDILKNSTPGNISQKRRDFQTT